MLVALMILVWGSGFPEPSEVVIVSYALLWVFFFFRFGWIAVMVGLFWWNLNMSSPLGVDVASSYFHPTVLVAFVMLAIASYGFKVSLAGRPAFGDLLVEESKLAIRARILLASGGICCRSALREYRCRTRRRFRPRSLGGRRSVARSSCREGASFAEAIEPFGLAAETRVEELVAEHDDGRFRARFLLREASAESR